MLDLWRHLPEWLSRLFRGGAVQLPVPPFGAAAIAVNGDSCRATPRRSNRRTANGLALRCPELAALGHCRPGALPRSYGCAPRPAAAGCSCGLYEVVSPTELPRRVTDFSWPGSS